MGGEGLCPGGSTMRGTVRPFGDDEEPKAFELLRRAGGGSASRFAPIRPGDLSPTFEQRLWESMMRVLFGKRVWRLGLWEGNRLTGWVLVKSSPGEASITCHAAPSPGAGRTVSLIAHGLELTRDVPKTEVHVWGVEPGVMEFLSRVGLRERLTLLTMTIDLT